MPQKQKTEKSLVVSTGAAARRKSAAPRTKATTTVPRKNRSTTPAETPSTSLVASTAVCEPTYDEIAALAYTYWEARGFQGGSPEEDWLRAELELRARA